MIIKKHYSIINKETGKVATYNGIKQNKIRSKTVVEYMIKQIDNQLSVFEHKPSKQKLDSEFIIKEEIIEYRL